MVMGRRNIEQNPSLMLSSVICYFLFRVWEQECPFHSLSTPAVPTPLSLSPRGADLHLARLVRAQPRVKRLAPVCQPSSKGHRSHCSAFSPRSAPVLRAAPPLSKKHQPFVSGLPPLFFFPNTFISLRRHSDPLRARTVGH